MSHRAILLSVLMLAFAGSALAHHGWSDYSDKPTTLTGVITEAGYSNPHGFVRLRVGGPKGKTWMVILAPPARMERRGLSREALKNGTTATVTGFTHREKKDELRAERITIAGKTTELR